MTTDRGTRNWFWIAAGAVGGLLITLLILRYQSEEDPAAQYARKYRRLDLVQRLRLDLATASEAEKSAVMAVTDEESKTFADQSRASTAAVEREREELGRLLQSRGAQSEKEPFSQFSQSFTEYQRIDRELLDLAVRNTNLKAYSLAFGPAAEAIREMDKSLTAIIAENAGASAPSARQAMLLAGRALSGALRTQALLPAHISEESDQKMDEMESTMATEDRLIRKDLDALAGLTPAGEKKLLATATAAYSRFGELREQILKLSRQNTNVRSLTISLNEKRRIVLKCQEALAALAQAVNGEPMPEPPASPR